MGPARLVGAVQKVHQWVTFATGAPFQPAIAKGLALPDSFYEGFAAMYRQKRDFLSQALNRAGFPAYPVEGSYFLVADVRSAGKEDDVAFARWLTVEHGVTAIPPSSFYGPGRQGAAKHLARFAFCKTEKVLSAAADRLARVRRA